MKLGSMSNWIVLLVGLLAVQLAQVKGDLIKYVPDFSKKGVEHPYRGINKDLCKKLKTDEYEKNAELVTEWYERVKDDKFFLLPQFRLRAAALKLISEFERHRKAGTWCQGDRLEEIGRLNKQQVKRHIADLRQGQPKGMLMCNRVFEIFFMQTFNHLKDCPRFYQANVRHSVDQLNEFRLADNDRALEPLIGLLQKRLKVGEASFELVQALIRLLDTDNEFDHALIELTAESVGQLAQPMLGYILEAGKVQEQVFKELNAKVYQPCTYLSTNLRASLGPASLDLENLDEFWEGGKQLPQVEQQMRSYGPDVYKIWAKYLVCNKLLELDYSKLGDSLMEKVHLAAG